MISVEDLHFTYRGTGTTFTALRAVKFAVEKGCFLTLLGPSGCGKTTLLRCIAGLEVPDSGRILIDGQVVYSSADGIEVEASARDLGMVFQSYAIWPHMTVAENAAFPLYYRRREMNKHQIRDRVLRCLELVRLDGLASRPAPMLSGGQQQRLALARALVSEPKVLLLDEPLSNLDARLREEMRFELRSITQRLGVTTIFVTHAQTEALSLSDYVVVMKDGQFIQVSTPRDLYNQPRTEFVATFVGRANLLPAEIIAKDAASSNPQVSVSTPIGRLDCLSLTPRSIGTRATLAVRPEAIEVRGLGEVPGSALIAIVEGVAFLGDSVECALRVGDILLIAKLPSAAAPAIGGNVAVSIRSSDCVLLV